MWLIFARFRFPEVIAPHVNRVEPLWVCCTRAGASERLGMVDRWFSASEMTLLVAALQRERFFPRTSSMGRLFDAVAALCGLPERVSFEGQAAMHLEFVADPNDASRYDFPIDDQFPAVADWQPLLHGIIEDRTAGVPIAHIAARFHNSLASLALNIAQRAGARANRAHRRLFSEPLVDPVRTSDPVGKRVSRVHSKSRSPGRRRHLAGANPRCDVAGWRVNYVSWHSRQSARNHWNMIAGMPMGNVEFGGITKDICLAYLPEIEVGDYVLVHVGFAISKIDEQEAQEIFSYIEQIGELSDMSDPFDARATTSGDTMRATRAEERS